jgi:hypothetical protein
MHLVDVDDVGAEPAQRIVDLAENPGAGAVAERLLVCVPAQPALRRQHDLLPATAVGERLADDFLRSAEPVDGSGVDQRDPALDSCVDSPNRVVLVRAAPHPAADRPRA